ncbi:MAG: hypothetical protein IPH88_01930 [Bacteroidales bacterium]|nr:hypothetical protein [Bacteroidales bacterium]
MKKNLIPTIIGLMFFLISTTVFSQDCGYYPVKKGAIMGYQSLDGKGKLTGTSRITITDVQQSPSSAVYNVKSEYWDDKNKPQQSRDYTMKCNSGEFSIDMQSLIDPKSMEGFKDMEVTFSGTDMVFPSSLSVGQVLPDANITMAAATGGMVIMKMTIMITNRKVESIETITVPAGTFECYKITYDLETKMGLKIITTAVQWMNKGAGAVKSESYDKKGKLLGSTVLNEFKL